MDFNLLEQLLDLPRVHISRFEQTNDIIYIWVYIPDGQHRCPRCGRLHRHVTETTTVKVRDLPVFGKTCYLFVQKGRLHCPCSYRGYEDIDFVDKYQKQTTRFNEFLFQLCDRMTIMDASTLMAIDWKRTYQTDSSTLKALKSVTPLPPMTVIGVDEISFKSHHRYFTVIYDLSDHNGVLYVSKDRREESLDEFFEQLSPQQKKHIKVVAMDMWEPYIASVRKNIPHADIVFDRFHIKKQLNDVVDKLRRFIVRNTKDSDQKSLLKNKMWVLRKNACNHTEADKNALLELKQINSPLYDGYLVKEQFDLFFDFKDAESGLHFLDKWYREIPDSIIAFFKPFYDMLQRHLYGITTYFKHRITNAVAEGINNKIKVLKRMAYGYRDHEYFKLKILRRCGYLKHATPIFQT